MGIRNVYSAAAEMLSMTRNTQKGWGYCHELQHTATLRHSAELPGAQDGLGNEEGKLGLESCLD